MKTVWMCWIAAWSVASAGAMGLSEDPQERLTKSWTLETVKSLEIRGQIDFELVEGPEPKVTVETTRALFDQLTVSNWWGAATVAIETGLRGPREVGKVKATIVLPNLNELRVSDRSSGVGSWPGTKGTLRADDHSNVELTVRGGEFVFETSWLTNVTLSGRVESLKVVERHQSQVDTANLSASQVDIELDESSFYSAGPTVHGTGTVRHSSQVTVGDEGTWSDLVLKEDSVRKVQTEKSP